MSEEDNMRLNGGTKTDQRQQLDDMLETENASLRERVADLERKVLEQGDELVCLRSTLADVLRRINQMDSTPRHNTAPPHGTGSTVTAVRSIGGSRNIATPSPSRIRYQPPPERDQPRRQYNHNSALPQRRAVHYQSTGSLHSGESTHSSNSSGVSPIPTPTSPSPTGGRASRTGVPSNPTPSPASTPSGGLPAPSPLSLAKRWSSTGDFNQAQTHPMISNGSMAIASRLATKSLFNLYMRPQQNSPNQKHGTRDASFNEEEGSVRLFLRGRPLVLYAPLSILNGENGGYELTRVATAPQQRLKLDWVYGYRGRDCRSNLALLPTGEMVYFVAAVCVLHNVEDQNQRHYLGHTDDVKCLAVHPNKLLVASGQTAGHDRREGRPHIRVWNTVSLHTLAVIGIGEFERSICCISFSKSDGGVLLCAVDEAPDHNISVWDWQRGDHGYKIAETKCSADTVVACEFHPLERNAIVTCGKSHLSFWTLDANGTLYKRMGIFETTRDKPKYVTSLAFTQTGDLISGDSNGNLIIWGKGTNTISKMIKNVHDGAIFSICVLKDGSIVSGGGKDGRLVHLDPNFNKTGLENQVPEQLGCVRALSEGKGSRQLLIGTTRNSVLISSLDEDLRMMTPVVHGHSDELWALAAHPSLPHFLTSGWDKRLHLWDSLSHSLIWSKELMEPIQSAAFSPDGGIIIIGTTIGKWFVMDADTRETYSVHIDGGEPIQVIKYSPDGNLLALGSRDNNIYIYQVEQSARKYNRIGRCTGHSSFITHLDWSEDSQYIQSNSGDYELLFWNAGLCRQIPQPTQLRDVAWNSHTCTLSFNTIGIWPEGADGTDVNSCTRSHNQKLMATADDFGKVKLYSYPVSQPKSLNHIYGGHSSHVTAVEFLHDDTRLISLGGRDSSVMQWTIL